MLKLSAVMIDHRYIRAYSSAMSFSHNVSGVGHRQACTLARRNAEVFLKYIHRNSVTMATISGHSVTVSGVTGVAEVTGHSRVPEQQVKGEQNIYMRNIQAFVGVNTELQWSRDHFLRNTTLNGKL